MAPFEDRFPVSELENRIHLVQKNFKDKPRKLPKDFNLIRDCPLHELVQYSCTSKDELEERAFMPEEAQRQSRIDCYPFVRLFRHCQVGNQDFRVETTAWEGRHKWVPGPKRMAEEEARRKNGEETGKPKEGADMFAKYGDLFSWPK